MDVTVLTNRTRAGTSVPPTTTCLRAATLPSIAPTVTGILLCALTCSQMSAIVRWAVLGSFARVIGRLRIGLLALRLTASLAPAYANHVETRLRRLGIFIVTLMIALVAQLELRSGIAFVVGVHHRRKH